MTTNHIEHLDEALIRPGRPDKRVHSQLADDFASMVPDQFFSLAEVLSFLLEQKNSLFGAVTGVENWIERTKAGSQLKREDIDISKYI